MQAFTKNVVLDKTVRTLCIRPYPNHPKGCPNYRKKKGCPPQQKILPEVYDVDMGFWVVWVSFDFASHCERMRRKHPNWSQRQVECCLYWQGSVYKKLRGEVEGVKYYLDGKGNWQVTYCPEGMGVNVTETMRNLGIELEWPPKNITYKVALLGIMKNNG